LKHDVYEAVIDLRKLLKMSVSFIIANAIIKYLDEIVQNFNNKNKHTDNLYDVIPDALQNPKNIRHLKDGETTYRRLTRLIFADWIPQDNWFVGSCLCLSSWISLTAAV
jgi:uncharacterized membrane protein